MKNLRYLITVLALVNAGLVAQASAAHHPKRVSLDTSLGKSISTAVVYANFGSHGVE